MQEISIENHDIKDFIRKLNSHLGGDLIEEWGEIMLQFDNRMGKGTIKSITFDWGVSLLDYDVNFSDDVKLIHCTGPESQIEFIFISEGKLGYELDNEEDPLTLERFQNIIVSPKPNSKKTFVFPKRANVKVNLIQIFKRQYANKKNNDLLYLNDVLSSVFIEKTVNLPYKHLGNFNLEIADEVRKMKADETTGLIRSLGIEGRLNIILAMQLLEHHNFHNEDVISDSLAPRDIKTIHRTAEFIVDNISESLTIAQLAEESGLSAKKLQTGFKMLYAKTVNEYMKTLKLEIARDYLKNSDLTVSEIVYRIGIKSRSYFSKIFSEYYGILPTDFRAKLKKKT